MPSQRKNCNKKSTSGNIIDKKTTANIHCIKPASLLQTKQKTLHLKNNA